MVEHTVRLICDLNPRYWFIENPRNMLRKLPIMTTMERYTIGYCSYGKKRYAGSDDLSKKGQDRKYYNKKERWEVAYRKSK